MAKWMVRIGITVLVVVMALGAIGMAAAQGPGRDNQAGGLRDRGTRGPGIAQALVNAVADATGLTAEDVLPELRDGKTFAEILTENDLDPDTVLADVTSTLTDEINQALEDGKISEDNAARALEELPGLLEAAMNGDLQEYAHDKALERLEDTALGVVADMAGVDIADVVKDVATPPTLAEIAESYGLDPDAVISELETRITDNVNQAVADGEMSADEAAAALDGLHDRLVERFDAPFRLPRTDGFDGRAPRDGGPRDGGLHDGSPRDGGFNNGAPNNGGSNDGSSGGSDI